MTVERDSMTLKGTSASALGVEERSDEPPRAEAEVPFNVIESLSTVMGSHLPPYSNSKGGRCLSHVGREGAGLPEIAM